MRLIVWLILSLLTIQINTVSGWSNGGYSDSPANPDIGTHDWIAERAVDLLPMSESTIFKDNINWLRYGTELPDRPKDQGGYGDFGNHHVYFDELCKVFHNNSARRANETYHEALSLLKSGNFSGGVMVAGAMSHYISDVAVWAHLMGKVTCWGAENDTQHDNYEKDVNDHISLFSVALITPLNRMSAYQATIDLANNTMFVVANATWMNNHYDWNNEQCRVRVAVSLNLAVNYVANVLHTLWLDAGQPIPELPSTHIALIIIVIISLTCKIPASMTGLKKREA